jgi:hypothetical protein
VLTCFVLMISVVGVLSHRTGVEGLYLAVQGSIEDLHEPQAYFSDKADAFIKEVLHMEPRNLALKFEAYFTSGLAGRSLSLYETTDSMRWFSRSHTGRWESKETRLW